MLVPDRYDDGGFSGGTLERPALQRLIADIEARRVDVVVVYKIDRLSRSLMDFAKLVEVFDRNSVTFVSVTQSFNTTTSMGRLTLNILLSFAQFEREVIGERIRDKFARFPIARHVDGRVSAARLRREGPQAGRERGRSGNGAHDFRAVRSRRIGHDAGALACRRRRAHQTGRADRPRLPLHPAEQPHLYRRGRSQGRELSRRASADHRTGPLGQGPRHPAGEPAQAGR